MTYPLFYYAMVDVNLKLRMLPFERIYPTIGPEVTRAK